MFTRLKTFLDFHINQSNNNRIAVFPIRCGIGKSTYIKYAIADAIRSGNHGLIIVTDSLTRMEKYTEDDFLRRNMNEIAILNNQTLFQEIKRQWYKPILIMSTQRYLALTKEEIISLTKYEKGYRTKIIIDEKADVFPQLKIGILAINNIDSALNEAIDDLADHDEKCWVVQQWKQFTNKVKATISEYEKVTSKQIEVWHKFETATITDDDERFFAFIKKHRTNLDHYMSNTCLNISAVKQIFNDGATFVGSKIASGKYENYFLVTLDKSELLYGLGVDTYVLDGTADIDPTYKAHFFDVVDCSQFNVQLDKLVINFVDLPTSKNNIVKSNKHAKAIIASIQNYIKTSPEPFDAVFTYTAIENQFKPVSKTKDKTNEEKKTTGHFGDLRGFNYFMDCVNIAQIGWNRYPDSAYRQLDYITRLAQYDYKHKTVVTLASKKSYIATMNKMLLVDFEQNLFRSKIRNIDCKDIVNYTVFCNVKAYAELIEMIRERYGKLGARINILPTPNDYAITKALERNSSDKTNVQIFLEWYFNQANERCFKTREMLDECALTLDQWRTIKKSDVVKEILSIIKTPVCGEYVVRK